MKKRRKIDRDPFKAYSTHCFYHFTDLENIDLIREHGGLFSRKELDARGISVPKPGGNEWSKDADKLVNVNSYVHLCFCNNHPMEYVAKKSGHIGETVYLEIDLSIRNTDGVMYSPDVSNKSGVELVSLDEAVEMIDFQVIYERTDWKDPKVMDRLKLARKCELLIPSHVPLKYIRNLPRG